MALTSNNRGGSLNEHQRRRLLVTSRYIDKLLSDVEEILNASASKSPFGRWRDDTSPVQRKVAQDYISRIRSQLVRVLESQDIVNPGPTVGSIHAIRTTLNFIDIAVEELKPKYMRGYGEVPEAVIPELNGIVNELEEVVRKLNLYLAQGLGQDLQGRLEKLDQAEDDIALLKTIERIIRDHGLVEFRPTLSIILQRLEEERFEIAFFGRVSAGKSSLLNYILQSEALPVGVNPITAVPTRIVYGPRPKLTVRFANNKTSTFEIKQLSEFATEQQNSANAKHVARISVELPSPRLRSGVVLVDTPGLGSLASAGAAETAAYLPRCDLGVVLIDAGSTLTQEDLSTIQALNEASIPALILLSKADLLAPEDRVQALRYIEDHVHSQLGLDLSAHAVSILGDHANLSGRWFEQEIVSLYGRHQQLAKQSIKRKVAALGEAVDTALRLKLERTPRNAAETTDSLRKVEGELRRAGGSIEEVRQARWLVLHEFYSLAEAALVSAAADVVKQWSSISEGKSLA
jgi:GTP-binding protein EngB required for normal cell division